MVHSIIYEWENMANKPLLLNERANRVTAAGFRSSCFINRYNCACALPGLAWKKQALFECKKQVS